MKKFQNLPGVLSTLDNCVIYNMFVNYKDQLSTQDVMLLQALRKQAQAHSTLAYYRRAAPLVRRIRQRSDSLFVWVHLYEIFGKDFLDLVRNGQHDQAMEKLDLLLQHTEKYF